MGSFTSIESEGEGLQYHRRVVLTMMLITISFIGLSNSRPVAGKGIVTATGSEAVPLAGAPPSGPVLWSCDFESGSMQSTGTDCFNVPNPSTQDVCPNSNNPGVVESSIVHSGKYAGYYASDGTVLSAVCRSYWNVQFGALGTPVLPAVTTDDFYIEAWVYVPSVNLTSWVSFMTVSFGSSGTPTINVDSDVAISSGRSLYVADHGFTNAAGSVYFRQSNPIPWPFDAWFKIGLELHLRSSDEPSTYTLYQNNVPVLSVTTNFDPSYAFLPNLDHMHFGLYMDAANSHFSVYNDDLLLMDLSGANSTTMISGAITPSTMTSTVTQAVTSLATMETTMTATPTVTTTLVPSSLGLALIAVLLLAGATVWGLKKSKRRNS